MACALAFAAASAPAWAAPTAQVHSADEVRHEVSVWLSRIHNAAQTQNYEGTFVYQRGGTVQSSRVVHYIGRSGGEFEQMESLDGKPRQLLRRDDDLYTLLPDSKTVIVDKRQSRDTFPALLAASTQQVLAVYEPRLGGDDRVANNDCQIIELDPKDPYRFAYKLWAEKKTGLLLRAQTLDANGAVLEQIAFSQIDVGHAPPPGKNPVESALRDTAGWHMIRSPLEPVDMQAEGWTIEPPVAGFVKTHELRRPMAARDPKAPPVAVDQAVFSDGMTAISIFIEPVDNSQRKEGVATSGATHFLVQRHGDFWVTLLGEVPLITLQRFASAIEYKAPK